MQNPKLTRKELRDGTVTYWAMYRDVSGRQRKFTWAGKKTDAQQRLNQIVKGVQDEKTGVRASVKKGVMLQELVDKYIVYCDSTKSAGTTQKAKFSLEKLVGYKGNVPLVSITMGFVDDYVAHRLKEVKPITVKSQVGSIKACFNQAVRWSLIRSNPWNGKTIKVVKEMPEYLKVEEVAALLEEVKGSDLEPLIRFYLFSGARRNEALTLEWQDVDLAAGKLTILGSKTKTGRARVLSFNQLPQLGALIRGLPQTYRNVFTQAGVTSGVTGTPYDPTTVSQRVKRIYRKLGFDERYSLHSLRKTWTTHNLLGGMPIHMVQAIGGWSSIVTLENAYSALLDTFTDSSAVVNLPY